MYLALHYWLVNKQLPYKIVILNNEIHKMLQNETVNNIHRLTVFMRV